MPSKKTVEEKVEEHMEEIHKAAQGDTTNREKILRHYRAIMIITGNSDRL